MGSTPSANPLSRARRSLAGRWDAAAVRRAGVIAERGRRSGMDQRTVDLASALVEQVAPTSGDPTTWSPAQRATRNAVVASWFDDVAAGRVTPSPEVQATVCQAFASLYQPTSDPSPNAPDVVKQTIVDQFHRLYYHQRPYVWQRTYYRGVRILKMTSDLWIYQNLFEQVRPGLIIETGTRFGGSAFWMADQLSLLGSGTVVTIDIEHIPELVRHPDVTYVLGSSSDPDVAASVRDMMPGDGSPVMVILDSDHSREHVLAELRVWADFVTPGSYLIVEDTNINGHPVYSDFGPGPFEAAAEFLATDDRFEVDEECHKYYVTQNPRGYLRRK